MLSSKVYPLSLLPQPPFPLTLYCLMRSSLRFYAYPGTRCRPATSRPRTYHYLLGALLVLTGFFLPGCGWAQTISVPLGEAAQFGLLSGGNIVSDSISQIRVFGAVGANGTITSAIQSDSGLYRPAGPTATSALTALDTARTYCAGLTGQPLAGQLDSLTLTAGVYSITGNATVSASGTLTLTGDSTSVFVFNVSGRLLAGRDAVLFLRGGVRPEHVFWNVTGVARLLGPCGWQGVVLGADSVLYEGAKSGNLVLLTSGSFLEIKSIILGILENYFAAPAVLSQRVNTVQSPCTGTLTSSNNQVPNWNFLEKQRCPQLAQIGWGGMPILDNMNAADSDVCGWYHTVGSGDFFNTCSQEPLLGVPNNSWGSQSPLNGESYVGVITRVQVPPGNLNHYREYVQTILPQPLAGNTPYYGEFLTVTGKQTTIASLPPAMWIGNHNDLPVDPTPSSIPSYRYQHPYLVYNSAIQIYPQIKYVSTSPAPLDKVLTDNTNWTSIGGFLTPPHVIFPGDELDMITIGNFRYNDDSPIRLIYPPNMQGTIPEPTAYYYISDVTLWQLPAAPNQYTGCGPAQIGWATDPVMPVALAGRVSYKWDVVNGVNGIGQIIGNPNQRQITVAKSGHYRLTVSIAPISPEPNQVVPKYQYPPVKVTIPTTVASLTSSSATFCPGKDPITLTAGTTPSFPGTTTYQLQAATAAGVVTYQAQTTLTWGPFSPTANTTYTVLATTPDGCTYSAATSVQVTPLPTVQITPASPTIFTASSPLTLAAAVTYPPGSPATQIQIGTWSWFQNGQVVTGPTSPTYSLNPAQFGPGQFLFTYTYPGPCGPQAVSTTVTILEGDCEIKSANPVYVLQDAVYTAQSAAAVNLFNDPAMTYYVEHDVVLLDGAFYLQAGCRILFAKDVKLTIGSSAQVVGYFTSTFTAACVDMWDGILVEDGGGLWLNGAEVSQSQRGIMLQYPDQLLNLEDCQFRSNQHSVTIVAGPETLPRAIDPDFGNSVKNCIFTVDQFMLPLAGSPNRSKTHLNIGNWDVRAWKISGNLFDKALIGVFAGERVSDLKAPGRMIGANLIDNDFTRCELAGILVPTHTWVGNVTDNTFTFSTAAPPLTPFMQAVITDYSFPTTVGVRTLGMFANLNSGVGESLIKSNTFTSPTAPTSYYGFGSLAQPTFTAPIGLYSSKCWAKIEANTFENLEAGLALGATQGMEIIDNSFVNCRLGVRFLNALGVFDPQPLRLTCNTFNRSTNLGQSAAILLDAGALIELARRDANGVLINGDAMPPTPGDGMKNLFAGGGQVGSGNENWHLYNPLANPSLVYKTFALNSSNSLPVTNTTTVVTFGNVNLSSSGMPVFLDPDHTCSEEDNLYNYGLQRSQLPTTSGISLTPVPNPADATVSFVYELPVGVRTAEILVRESISGQIVARYPVSAATTTITVPTTSLPSGLYLAVLNAGGRRHTSVRLQIAH